MDGEHDTPEDSGTDNAQPHETDTPDELDYFDPDEDQDTDDISETEGTDDEAQANDETEEQPEVEEEAEEEGDEQAETALVTLADGNQVTHDELVKGYLRQSDYTRKQQETSNARQKVVAEAERMERITKTFVEHLTGMVPEAPNPAMAYSDPDKFRAMQTQHDAAVAQVENLIKLGSEPTEIKAQFSEEDAKNLKAAEEMKLVEALPETATREGRTKFWGKVQEVAQEVGFSADDLSGVTDHRVFLLANLANKGLEAERAKTKAKAKAAKAAPVTPRKPGQGAKQANRNGEAMRKLARSGSMRDALAIDFD